MKLQESEIKQEDAMKFLGVIFDRRLNWSKQINYIADKCKNASICSDRSQGKILARTKALLTIYRALIRPIIEYADIAYDNPSNYAVKKNSTLCKPKH